jgi:hypothetical protein
MTLPGVLATSRPTTIVGAYGPLACDGALGVLHVILKASDQVKAAGGNSTRQDFGIGQRKIRRRKHVENLPRGELDHVLVALGNATQSGGGVVPPLLLQQKALIDEVERKFVPSFICKTVILRQRLDAIFRLSSRHRVFLQVVGEPHRLAHRLVGELDAFTGRVSKLRRPIQVSLGQRGRRDTRGEARGGGVQSAVGDVGQRGHAVGIAVLLLAGVPHPRGRARRDGHALRCRDRHRARRRPTFQSYQFSRLLWCNGHRSTRTSESRTLRISAPLA